MALNSSFVCDGVSIVIRFAMVIVAVAIMSQRSQAVETGLEIGNNLQAVELTGDLLVYCNDSRSTDMARHRCSRLTLDPAEMSRFVVDPIEADYVTLKASRADGARLTKNDYFDGQKGKSSGRFNLWISTLLQRPMLDIGKNEIAYDLKFKGQVVKSGNFTVNVVRGPGRRCRYDRIDSRDLNDCRSSHNICGQYFRQNNFCE
jgi:hypothetical protein